MALFREVEAGPELERVFALPRRPIPDPTAPENLALARELTERMRRVPVPYPFKRPGDHLYATQALMLKEFWERKGLLGLVRAGGGKSLVAYLAFALIRPTRGLLIVPASMLEDTRVEWEKFARDWRGLTLADITVLSYEKISTPASGAKVLADGTEIYADIIRRHNPDLIICDEVHRFGEMTAAGTRRLGRFLASCEENGERVPFLGMTGTFIRRSFKDGAHIAEWALWENSPLPREWEELQAWSDACDARTSKGGKRTDYGALLDYLSPEERRAFDETEDPDDARGIVCGMLGRRMLETPGVIGSQDGPLAIPAKLEPWYVEAPDDAIEDEYRKLLEGEDERAAWTLPDGTVLPDAKALARPLATLSYGLLLMQDPLPPPDYRMAASAWNSSVREVIRYRPGLRLDSEYMVRDAVRSGVLPELSEILEAWEAQRAAYTARTGLREPPSKPTWVSDEVVREVARWLADGPGLVWVSFIALGERLSKELGLAYFGQAKCDAKGRHVTKLRKGESAIVSIGSVGTGTNGLQFIHHRNLWLGTPSEQSLARTHRPGQEASCVVNDIYLGSAQLHRRFWRAHQLATNFAGRVSMQAQRLAYFQNGVPEGLGFEGRRWSNTTAVDASIGEDA